MIFCGIFQVKYLNDFEDGGVVQLHEGLLGLAGHVEGATISLY
jgi:hypothetical protein